jgi:hypothetical protein
MTTFFIMCPAYLPSALPCSWIFSRDCIFSQQTLQQLLCLLVPGTLRVKGVFRVAASTWVAASAAPGPAAVAAQATAGVAAAGAAAAEATPAAAGGAGGIPVELRETAYRRDSRVEIILDTAATAAAAAAAAAAGVTPAATGGSGSTHKQRVTAALGHAGAGDWAALEALLLATLEPDGQ